MPAAMQPCLSFFAIWSDEHRQYWTQDAYDYTPGLDKAGFLSAQEAHQIISSAGEVDSIPTQSFAFKTERTLSPVRSFSYIKTKP